MLLILFFGGCLHSSASSAWSARIEPDFEPNFTRPIDA
jgi:hypothetical protein